MTKVAVTQMSLGWDIKPTSVKQKAPSNSRRKWGKYHSIEVFATVYFCPEQNPKYFDHAYEVEGHPFWGGLLIYAANWELVVRLVSLRNQPMLISIQ